MSRYDEDRDLTVLEDGTPLVEASQLAGTETVTRATGEHADADDQARYGTSAGTSTFTAVRAEREDDDALAAWGATEVDTRGLPADVKQG
jgi:hypothetical protein